MTFFEPNVKIVGGVAAVPNSWPALAYLNFEYATDIVLDDVVIAKELYLSSVCSATLLDRKTLLTAAHGSNTNKHKLPYQEKN